MVEPVKPMSEEELQQVAEREKVTTPGPWKLDPHYEMYVWGPQSQMVADEGGDEEGTLTRMRGVGANLPLKANGQFIAHARTDIPRLLATIRDREAQRDAANFRGEAFRAGLNGIVGLLTNQTSASLLRALELAKQAHDLLEQSEMSNPANVTGAAQSSSPEATKKEKELLLEIKRLRVVTAKYNELIEALGCQLSPDHALGVIEAKNVVLGEFSFRLDEKDREIERLRGALPDPKMLRRLARDCECPQHWQKRALLAEQLNETYRKALEPFAEAHRQYSKRVQLSGGRTAISPHNQITYQDFARAAEALSTSAPQALEPWDESRCRICGWPLRETIKQGCTKASCSMRPAPSQRADTGHEPSKQ